VRELNNALLAQYKQTVSAERNVLRGLNNHLIILSPALPWKVLRAATGSKSFNHDHMLIREHYDDQITALSFSAQHRQITEFIPFFKLFFLYSRL
jgi:hypothetical protein